MAEISIKSLILLAQYDLKYSESKNAIQEATNKIDSAVALIYRGFRLEENISALKDKYGTINNIPKRGQLTKEEKSLLKNLS